MPVGYEFIDHTADYAIRATGRDFPELVANAAAGLIALMADTTGLSPTDHRIARADGEDREHVLARSLKQVLRCVEDGQLPLSATVIAADPSAASLRIDTTPLSPVADRVLAVVKAVTYHALQIIEGPDGLSVEVVFDT